MNNVTVSLEQFTDRQIGLDIYRIVSVLFVFLFHSNIHIGCYYGIMNNFINMGAIFMTAFFLLSGYCLFFTYHNKDLVKIQNIQLFYLKRIIGIFPLYYFVAIVFILFLGSETLKQNLLLAPIEILGLQSTFTSIFSVTHNGGTWFVSCIFLCYLVYPLIQTIMNQISAKCKLIIITICLITLFCAPFIEQEFKTGPIYANPFFRGEEFIIGVVLCSLMKDLEQKGFKWLFSKIILLVEFLILIICVSIMVKLGISVGNYMLYSLVALPMFIMLLVSISRINILSLKNNRIVNYLCEISYAFFLAQFFTFKSTSFLLKFINLDSNIFKIVLSFCICMIYAIMLHEIVEKPCSKFLKKKLIKV